MFYTLMLIYYFYNLKNIISVKKELVPTVYKTHNDENRYVIVRATREINFQML